MKPPTSVEELSEKIVRTILHMKETEAPREQMFAKVGKYIQHFLETRG